MPTCISIIIKILYSKADICNKRVNNPNKIEESIEQLEISFSSEIVEEIIIQKTSIVKHRKQLSEDGFISLSIEKHLKRVEKQLASALIQLIKHLKSNISAEKLRLILDKNGIMEKNTENGETALCHTVGCKKMAIHRCGRCLSVSYCDQACANKNWDKHKTECVENKDKKKEEKKRRKSAVTKTLELEGLKDTTDFEIKCRSFCGSTMTTQGPFYENSPQEVD